MTYPRCGRCRGCLVWEPTTLIDIRYRWSLGAWRCLNCGDWLDMQTYRERHAKQFMAT